MSAHELLEIKGKLEESCRYIDEVYNMHGSDKSPSDKVAAIPNKLNQIKDNCSRIVIILEEDEKKSGARIS